MGLMPCVALALAVPCATLSQIAPGPGFQQPMRHGVVFWQPQTAEDASRELDAVVIDGFRLIKLASWCWTLPSPGSDVEASAQSVLDGCDTRGLAFFLLQNIQFGSPGEGGGLEQAIADPLAARVFLDDWVRVLQGHPCVAGVLLGNEVGPVLGSPSDTPVWWAGLLDHLRATHGDLQTLNSSWGTAYADWNEVSLPTGGSPGMVDVRGYAEGVFADFYGALFDGVLRPTLGPLEYGVKAGGDPFLHRCMERASVIGWDDVLANHPQWRIKALCDIGRLLHRPVFNAELHLYHDTYVFRQSPAMTRYRYMTSALNGETTTASFAWEQWSNNPDTAEVHSHTPTILRELDRLAEPLAALASAEPEVHVLLTRSLCEGADDGTLDEHPRAELLYADAAGLGIPWRFVLPVDLADITAGTLVIPADPRLSPTEAEAIASLPPGVRVVCVQRVPDINEYGRPLDRGTIANLTERCEVIDAIARLRQPASDPGPPYTATTETPYLWWQPDRGHFTELVRYPQLEARRVPYGRGWLIAVVNHATEGEPVQARLPWAHRLTGPIRELTTGGGPLSPRVDLTFAPLSVRLFLASGHR